MPPVGISVMSAMIWEVERPPLPPSRCCDSDWISTSYGGGLSLSSMGDNGGFDRGVAVLVVSGGDFIWCSGGDRWRKVAKIGLHGRQVSVSGLRGESLSSPHSSVAIR